MRFPNSKPSIMAQTSIHLLKISWLHSCNQFKNPATSYRQVSTTYQPHRLGIYPSLSRSRHHLHNLTSSSRCSTPVLSLVLVPACPFLNVSTLDIFSFPCSISSAALRMVARRRLNSLKYARTAQKALAAQQSHINNCSICSDYPENFPSYPALDSLAHLHRHLPDASPPLFGILELTEAMSKYMRRVSRALPHDQQSPQSPLYQGGLVQVVGCAGGPGTVAGVLARSQ
ncbi:uncharacterized protein F5891DRAFT_27341 [Suillus fuscotomentosus]|uniref:Uncharacterized protein n=1 Tax=Suillus fuscotomentosus TaxID=1912939 RepID=A0AAD4EMG3_9AGAM|nr:uncharacterized protein F5891DRAFT_27341 [Suillus fuscotomentosus]KAG1908810.1 hypothetical protein F5891DRAFT_27341 [Suillus fuscotomentosus]